MTSQVSAVPDAAVMVIASVLEERGYPRPLGLARSIAAAVTRDGWVVSASTGRATTNAVDGPSGARPKGNAHSGA